MRKKKNIHINRTLFFAVFVVGIVSLGLVYMDSFTENVATAELTQIQFEQTEIEMGQLEQGKPQSATFQFKNTGQYAIMIQHVETSCGCTQSEWPKHPVKPGETGDVNVTYDAKYPGWFRKTIKVFCNTENGVEELMIKGEVLPSEQLTFITGQ
jgi:hypothetical protein